MSDSASKHNVKRNTHTLTLSSLSLSDTKRKTNTKILLLQEINSILPETHMTKNIQQEQYPFTCPNPVYTMWVHVLYFVF